MSNKAEVEAEAYKVEADAKREEAKVHVRTLENLLFEVSKRADDEFLILKRAFVGGSASSSTPHANKLKVPDPKHLHGVRNAKEL